MQLINSQQLSQVAEASGVHENTILRYLAGLDIWDRKADKVSAAMVKLGFDLPAVERRFRPQFGRTAPVIEERRNK